MRRVFLTFTAVVVVACAASANASANFHLIKIREVATNPAGADTAFIELQMYEPGQNLVNGHTVNFYTATGTLLASFALTSNAPNVETQRTILIGDTAAAGAPDFTYPALADAVQTYGPGGAACFDNIDCVSWGGFTGAALLPSPPGNPAPAIPDGSSLTRSIAPGCATLLEATDDTENSVVDFALTTPTPRNNATFPTEIACGGSGGAPETTITKAPKKKSAKAKAKFKFTSSVAGAKFMCKLDKGDFKSCSSPFKKKVDVGKHKFQVYAVSAAGVKDSTPAKAKFKRVED